MTIKQQGGIFGRNPTFNNVDVEGTLTVNGEPISDFGTMAQQDANNVNIDGGSIDNVTIGGSTAAIAVTSKLLTSTGTAGNIQTDSAGNRISMTRPGANYLVASTAGGTLNFGTNGVDTQAYIDTSGNLNCLTGNVVMANGKGIDFSATSGTGTSELLDDYEEGTWTPTIIGSTAAGTGTYSLQSGAYIKTGNMIFARCRVTWSAHTGTGNMSLGGLPYANGSGQQSAATIGFTNNLAVTSGKIPIAHIGSAQTKIDFWEFNTAGGGVNTQLSLDTAADLIVSIVYNQ